MPSSSSGISGSCASCAAGPAGSLSAPRSKVSRLWRRGLHFPLDGPVTAAAAAPPRMEALFLPCPGGGLHRQGRRPTSSVKSYIVINNRRTPGGLFVLYAGRCPIIPTALTPCGPSLTTPRRSRAVLSSGPMSAKIPRPRRKNSGRVFVSGQRRGVVHPLGASCAAAPQSSPSSGYAG